MTEKRKTYESSRRPVGPRPASSSVDGVLLVDKPSDWTSHDVVAKIRGHFGFKKVGHGGTLDPVATGLLVILLGRGTKLSNQIMGGDKTYEGTLQLGATTDTHDVEGQVLSEADPSTVTEQMLRERAAEFVGDLMQVPPMVSAIKKNGVPLYKLARAGKTVEREARFLHIFEFDIHAYTPPVAAFEMRCSKGTYVRTLCHDLGQALGCGAYMKSLRRTASGHFSLSDALPLADILELPLDELREHVVPIHRIPREGVSAG